MLTKFTIHWTAKTLIKNVRDGNVNFDCAIQRGYTWDIPRKSLLIHSLLEDFPIPPFFFAQNDDHSYDGLDGKQRTNAILTFVDGEWELEDGFIVVDEDDVEHDFSSYSFADLPKWAQDAIKDYGLIIFYFQDLSEDQYQEMFYRLNNGKPLTAVELTRVKTKSLHAFQEIAKHDMVDLAVTEKSKIKFGHEQLVMQAWAACFALDDNDDLSFETKVFRPFMEKAEINELHIKEMKNYFNILYNMYNSCDMDDKIQKKVAAKIKTRTHLIALCSTIQYALSKDYEINHLIDWVKVFFSGKNGTSVDAEYNNAAGGTASGTSKRAKIDARLNAMIGHMSGYMKRIEQREDRVDGKDVKSIPEKALENSDSGEETVA